MLEMIAPKSERGSWKMFFIGLLYSSLSLILVKLFFGGDRALSKFSGIWVILFTVMFTLPYMYYIIRREEKEDEEIEGFKDVWRVHSDAIFALVWLFLGFVVAFSFWNVVLYDPNLLNAQVRTYCMINNPENIEGCFEKYSAGKLSVTGATVRGVQLLSIIENNVSVMIFTLIFSLVFGAGAICVLAWNASVISAAIGIFSGYQAMEIPKGIARYMIHGVPEITSYFITALAGGMFGIGIIRHGFLNKKFLRVFENAVILIFIAIALLVFGALVEVYITPGLF